MEPLSTHMTCCAKIQYFAMRQHCSKCRHLVHIPDCTCDETNKPFHYCRRILEEITIEEPCHMKVLSQMRKLASYLVAESKNSSQQTKQVTVQRQKYSRNNEFVVYEV